MKPAPGSDVSIDALFVAFQTVLAGRYSLGRELGRGGMGVVYLAREVRLDRQVAIKLLPPEFATQERLRDRFLREARMAARLSHPYIVPIHSVDEVGDFVFYVMAYVDGETLAQRVAARGPLPPHEATRVLREVAWALAYAHAQGVVHRDVKPANILLERGTERAMVTDFGIARLTQTSGQTAVGELLGTPEYMSPEQAGGDEVDGRSDLYALGAVGYFALTGQPPFVAPSTQAVLAQQITKAATPVSTVARGVPTALARTIDRCLEKDPSARFATGEALAEALETTLDKRPEIPVPIRVFLDRRRIIPLIMAPVMTVPLFIGIMAPLAHRGAGLATLVALGGLGLVIAGSIPAVIVSARLRSLLRLGYGPDDIAAALRVRYERQREEFMFAHGTSTGMRERLVRFAGFGGIALGGVAAISILAGGPADSLAPLAAMSAYFGTLLTVLSTKWRRLRRGTGPKWAELWQGKPGRLMESIAGVKLGQRAVLENRPTEMAIALSAEALFDGFSKEIRESLGDVPAALRALEAHAHAARARIAELDATLADATRTPRGGSEERQATVVAELRAARDLADKRLADVVTALENVRLDLLRLHAGTGPAEGITQDLAAARALGEDADRLLAGLREAGEAIRR